MILPRIVTLLTAASSLALTAGCRANGDGKADAASATYPWREFHDAICNGERDCVDIDYERAEVRTGAYLGVKDCRARESVVLFGSWPVEEAASRSFEWEAEARYAGVFPSRGHVGTNMGCYNEHEGVRSPEVEIALDPDGFAWALLKDDDVFITYGGMATIDHDFHATATIDRQDAASAPRVTVSIEGPHGLRTRNGGLGRGDTFAWGAHRATVVRIIEPHGWEDGTLGVIGWVEISLSDG